MAGRPNAIYFVMLTVCRARLIALKAMGAFLDMIAERSFALLNDRRMLINFSTTSSIRGRRAGLSCVIKSTKSSMNSKPRYF
jgi:hypothetical protein